MVHAFALAGLLALSAANAYAADIYADVYGVAHIPKPQGGITEILTHGSPLPNGGRAFDFFDFSHGGALCTPFTGQENHLCATARARVEIDRRLVQTTSFIGTMTDVRLKAMARIDYRNVSGGFAQLWGRATVVFPIICHGSVLPPIGGLNVSYRLDGEYNVSSSDPAITIDAPRPFETCAGGHCVMKFPSFECPPEGATTNVTIDLYPRIQISNPLGRTGWTVQAVSDYSHTMTIEGMDVLDANGDPMPNVRAVVPGANGAINDTFLTAVEYEEAAANSSTTSTTATVTTTTGGGASTTTTLPLCAGLTSLQAADCRCDLPPAGCDGLKRPIAKGLAKACNSVDKAVTATGKAQRRLGQRAAAAARSTLATVNGRKGNALSDGCREALRTFLGALRSDLTSPPR